MNITKATLLASTMAITLAGCMGGDSNPIKTVVQSAAAPECAFHDAPGHAAPLWVCDAPVEGVSVQAIGSHEKSAAGMQFMKDQAAASARVTLAQQLRVKVTNMIKQYAETTGAGSSETVDKVNTSVSKLITAETISGSRIIRSTTSPKGMVYVLVGIDPITAKKATEDVLKTSMNNDRAMWQQFKAHKGQEELAAEVAKMTAGQ